GCPTGRKQKESRLLFRRLPVAGRPFWHNTRLLQDPNKPDSGPDRPGPVTTSSACLVTKGLELMRALLRPDEGGQITRGHEKQIIVKRHPAMRFESRRISPMTQARLADGIGNDVAIDLPKRSRQVAKKPAWQSFADSTSGAVPFRFP